MGKSTKDRRKALYATAAAVIRGELAEMYEAGEGDSIEEVIAILAQRLTADQEQPHSTEATP